MRSIAALILALTSAPGCSPLPAPAAASAGPGARALELSAIPSPLYAGRLFSLKGEVTQLFFHLNLSNRGHRPLQITRVRLITSRRGEQLSVRELDRALLKLRLRPAPWIAMHDRQSIAAAHRTRGQLHRAKGDTTILPGESIALSHQLFISRPRELPDKLLCVVEHDAGRASLTLPVLDYQQETALRLPFNGMWWVMAGHRFDEDHGDAVLSSQNFAYDMGKVGPHLNTYNGDPRKNEHYLAHGEPILAAARGEVVEVVDDIPENVPPGTRPALQEVLIRPTLLAGNYVVLKHRDREYTAYLHLRPGASVQRGMKVAAGQEVGRCGNSGNSLETHIHFQLQDGPDPLKARGLPARFSDFTIHLAHLRLHVPPTRPMPLPLRLVVEHGRNPEAAPLPPPL